MLSSGGLHADVTLSNIAQSPCSMPQAYTFLGVRPVEHARADTGSGELAPGAQVDIGHAEGCREIQVHDHERTAHCTHNMAPQMA
jgi:hypothetical protein